MSTGNELAVFSLLQRPVLSLVLGSAFVASSVLADSVDFGSQVQPLLSDRCFACHGPDETQRQAGLRLDVREAALAPSASGRVAVRPGDPDASELLRRVESENPSTRMPPAYMGHAPLDSAQVAVFRDWILQGAEYETHWAFEPPRRLPEPPVSDADWPRLPIDSFVLARLDASGLQPSPEVSPARWLRRMKLDLNGLPPSPNEIGAFESLIESVGEEAYEIAVEEALSSPRYGERMAMDWLDVARYADTHGFNNDSERSMWPWRDWVIAAFNTNLPYDRFIVDQLAGDLLPDPAREQLIATGFNRNHVINSEGGIIEEEYRVEYVADRVRTLGMAWLGLTLECARCHDHKFDPITQEDYYRFFAFFDKVPEFGEAGRVANAVPMMQAPTMDQELRIGELRARVKSLEHGDRAEESRWEPSEEEFAGLAVPEHPGNAELFLGCDEGGSPGIAGNACESIEVKPEEPLKLEDHGAFTLSLWVLPHTNQDDAPLFSAIDYSPDPAASKYGAGIDLRIVGDEIEVRLSKRFPSYSMTVRSVSAGLQPGQWRQVAVVYEGSEGRRTMRAKAAWVRLFVDGRECGTTILHDDAQSAAAFMAPIRLGHDNRPGRRRFEGLIDEAAVWTSALTPVQIRQLFEAVALPWALSRSRSSVERHWLYRALHPNPELERTRHQLFALERSLPTTMVMREMESPRQTHVLRRGRYDSPGDPVQAGVPEKLLGSWPEGAPLNRMGLALWLTAPDHPTTARVVVNRFWQQLFGVGLVKTSGDFGVQGESPSHPELLDWLAVEFMESGWDVKALLRQIVLSATYRQDSAAGPALLGRDPENRLLSRGPRFRLPAEVIRDQVLWVAGLLTERIGGPSVRPYQPEGLYDGIVVGAAYPGTTWEQGVGEDLYRRSLYTFWKRTLPHPTMTVFDAPDREFCTVRRSTTNTPLQALTLMNDPTFVEAARKLAERTFREAGPTEDARVAYLFEVATGRRPQGPEARILSQSLARLRQSFGANEEDARAILGVGASPADASFDTVEIAAYTALANLVLNLDEVITKG